MNKLLKSIPITGDMVSLWLPSGQNRAMDIIRGNHGQCYGTHPNVPVLSNLINSSLGWHFDGTDDYVGVVSSNSLNLGTADFTLGCWLKTTTDEVDYLIRKKLGDGGANPGWFLRTGSGKLIGRIGDLGGSSGELSGSISINDNKWHFAVSVFDRSGNLELFVDGNSDGTIDITGFNGSVNNVYHLFLGSKGGVGSFFDGYIVLPFIVNQVWSVQQINNFYLATRDFFLA